MNDPADIEQQWAALNGDQAASSGLLDDRQILQREQDHFGFIVVGSPDDWVDFTPGTVLDGIYIGTDRQMAPDIKLRVIGPSSLEEWREHVLFNVGPLGIPEFERFAGLHPSVVRAIAE